MSHVVSGCKSYLDEGRYTYRHNSALQFDAYNLKFIRNTSPYVKIPGFPSLCILTGEQLRSDMLFLLVRPHST